MEHPGLSDQVPWRKTEGCHVYLLGSLWGSSHVWSALRVEDDDRSGLQWPDCKVACCVCSQLLRYCKLPSYHHPVLANDCLNATIYFLKHLESFGVDPSRLVPCGESIGGWAVATVTHVLTRIPGLPQVQKQVLIQPILNLVNFQLPSYQQSKNVPFLTRDMLFMCMCKYLAIDLSWKDATLAGAVIPLDKWKKYQRWISHENIPRRFWR